MGAGLPPQKRERKIKKYPFCSSGKKPQSVKELAEARKYWKQDGTPKNLDFSRFTEERAVVQPVKHSRRPSLPKFSTLASRAVVIDQGCAPESIHRSSQLGDVRSGSWVWVGVSSGVGQ